MNKAEKFFWKNLPKHNLTSQNVINRERVNFDDIIELMNNYAQQVSREKMEDSFKAGMVFQQFDNAKDFNKWWDWLKEQEE